MLFWASFGLVMAILIEFQHRGEPQPKFFNLTFLLSVLLLCGFFGYLWANWKWKDYEQIAKRYGTKHCSDSLLLHRRHRLQNLVQHILLTLHLLQIRIALAAVVVDLQHLVVRRIRHDELDWPLILLR